MSQDITPKRQATTRTPQRTRSKARETLTDNREWQPDFLAALAEYGVVQYACDAAGIARSTAYKLRANDEAFAALFDEAREVAWDKLEQEVYRRAVEGVKEPLVSGGRVVRDDAGEIIYVRRYSDSLALAMLKAKRSAEYRDTTRHEVRGVGEAAIHFVLSPGEQHGKVASREIEE